MLRVAENDKEMMLILVVYSGKLEKKAVTVGAALFALIGNSRRPSLNSLDWEQLQSILYSRTVPNDGVIIDGSAGLRE